MKKSFIALLAIIFLLPCGVTATAIHDACKVGNLQEVEKLITEGADVNATGEDDWTPLHWAADKGHKDIVQTLLDGGAEVNATDKYNGWTPLHMAADSGYKEVVQALLARGAKVNATNKHLDLTPLYMAAKEGHKEVVQELTAAPIVFDKPNHSNSELSETALKKLDNYYSQVFDSVKKLHGPVMKSITKNMFPIKKDDKESILRALLKLSYQDLKDNPEQERSSFAKLFIREFYKNHLIQLKLYITIKSYDERTAIDMTRMNHKDNIVNYLAAINNVQSYDELNEDLRTKTERNYQQLVGYKKLAC